MSGYIYFRDYIGFHKYNAYKLGKTDNIYKCDVSHTSHEIIKGKFMLVLETSMNDMDTIYKLIKLNFNNYNIRRDGGHDFFDKCIIGLIENYLLKMGFKFRILNNNEIINLIEQKK